MLLLEYLSLLLALSATSFAIPVCKITPAHLSWPSHHEWGLLNRSIGGVPIKLIPVVSSCCCNNQFNSPEDCTNLRSKLSYAAFRSTLPERIDFTIWTNNSCLPKGVTGYMEGGKGYSISGLAQPMVSATIEKHIVTAMKWACQRSIRIVGKEQHMVLTVGILFRWSVKL